MIWRRRKPTQRPRPQVIFCPYCCTLQPIPTTDAERNSAPQREETTMPDYEGSAPQTGAYPMRDSVNTAELDALFRLAQRPQIALEEELDTRNIGEIRDLLGGITNARAEYRQRLAELVSLEENTRNYLAETSQFASASNDPGPGPGQGAYVEATRKPRD